MQIVEIVNNNGDTLRAGDEVVLRDNEAVIDKVIGFHVSKSTVVEVRLVGNDELDDPDDWRPFEPVEEFNPEKEVEKRITIKSDPARYVAEMWDNVSRLNEKEVNDRFRYYNKSRLSNVERKVHSYTLEEIIEIGYLAERARDLGINKGWIVK